GAHQRHCVIGVLPGQGGGKGAGKEPGKGANQRRAVVLTGHFDTVETASYGDLQPLALDPARLAPALVEKLAAEADDPDSARALADLKSGAFLPGRGLLDMKGGLAAGLAVLEAVARLPDFD